MGGELKNKKKRKIAARTVKSDNSFHDKPELQELERIRYLSETWHIHWLEMKCIIPGTNARVFAKAIQSMAKIGSELFVEAKSDGLSIRMVSSTKSAFAMIRFDPNFFNDYNLESNTQDEFANKCKISMKACIGVFKNMKQANIRIQACRVRFHQQLQLLQVRRQRVHDQQRSHQFTRRLQRRIMFRDHLEEKKRYR